MTTTKIAAFTLIEMSIVLIIIGLIVAGIAKGQSMIHNAKVMSVVSFIEKKKVAIRTFEMKYDALPGDMNNATDYWPSGVGNNGTVTSGDGDLKIEWSGEAHQVWKHLFLAGMTDESLTGVMGGNQAHNPGENIPELQLKSVGVGLYWSNNNALLTNPTNNHFVIGKAHPTNTGGVNIGAAVSPPDAYVIDKKLDDGLPASGKIISINSQTPNGSWVACVSSSVYLLSATDLRCVMIIDID